MSLVSQHVRTRKQDTTLEAICLEHGGAECEVSMFGVRGSGIIMSVIVEGSVYMVCEDGSSFGGDRKPCSTTACGLGLHAQCDGIVWDQVESEGPLEMVPLGECGCLCHAQSTGRS